MTRKLLIATSQLKPMAKREESFSVGTRDMYIVVSGNAVLYKGDLVSRNFKPSQVVSISKLMFLSNNSFVNELNDMLSDRMVSQASSDKKQESSKSSDAFSLLSSQDFIQEVWSMHPIGLVSMLKLNGNIVDESRSRIISLDQRSTELRAGQG